jgi:hypothetical protein
MTSKELKRELAALGATFKPGKGSHLHVELNGNSLLSRCITKTFSRARCSPSKSNLGSSKGDTMQYPAKILCESDGCTVTFPDIPEAITCGDKPRPWRTQNRAGVRRFSHSCGRLCSVVSASWRVASMPPCHDPTKGLVQNAGHTFGTRIPSFL